MATFDDEYEDSLDDFLPEGFSADSMTERELELVEFFLEEKWEELDENIEEVEQALQSMNGNSAAFINADHELCVPFHTLRRLGYEQGDKFEVELKEGDLLVKLIKKPWQAPDWLQE